MESPALYHSAVCCCDRFRVDFDGGSVYEEVSPPLIGLFDVPVLSFTGTVSVAKAQRVAPG